MNVVSRGVRNAFRNQIRTFSIVAILGLSIGLALSMLVARQAVENKISSVKQSIGNTITISPAGAQGFQGGGEPLTTDQLSKITTLANITGVVETLNDRLTTADTNLVSAIDPGTLGNRQARNSGVDFTPNPSFAERANSGNPASQFTRTFTPPIVATGTNNVTATSVFGGSTISYTSGQAFDPSKDVNEAIVGKGLATKNNLVVGSTFTAYGTAIKVDGIYDTGTTFSNAGLILPLPTLQRLSSQAGSVTSAIVTVNSIDNVQSVLDSIKNTLGTTADVVSNQDTAKQAVAPLESVKTISTYSLIGALLAGAVIILLTMVMIVRERRREIGVMKAIGASNLTTMFQFISEAVTLTLLGMVVGILIGVIGASPITKVLVTNSSSTSATATQTGQGFGRGLRGIGNNSLTNIRNIKTSVGINILIEGFGSAMVIAVIGSAVPAILISKIRPAEVMRAE